MRVLPDRDPECRYLKVSWLSLHHRKLGFETASDWKANPGNYSANNDVNIE